MDVQVRVVTGIEVIMHPPPGCIRIQKLENIYKKISKVLHFTVGIGITATPDINMTGVLHLNTCMFLPSGNWKPVTTSNSK